MWQCRPGKGGSHPAGRGDGRWTTPDGGSSARRRKPNSAVRHPTAAGGAWWRSSCMSGRWSATVNLVESIATGESAPRSLWTNHGGDAVAEAFCGKGRASQAPAEPQYAPSGTKATGRSGLPEPRNRRRWSAGSRYPGGSHHASARSAENDLLCRWPPSGQGRACSWGQPHGPRIEGGHLAAVKRTGSQRAAEPTPADKSAPNGHR